MVVGILVIETSERRSSLNHRDQGRWNEVVLCSDPPHILVRPVSVLIAIAKESWLCLISIMLALLLLFTPLILLMVLHVESYQEISSDPSSVFADVRLKLKFGWTFRSRPVHAQYKSSLVSKYSQNWKIVLSSTIIFKGCKFKYQSNKPIQIK